MKKRNMKITKTYSWNRRDFSYDAKCENCGHETKSDSGYDDDNYYNNVVANSKCPSCKHSSVDLGTEEIIKPKHDPNVVM